MDLSLALNKTVGILTYDAVYHKDQIIKLILQYYPDKFSHIFNDCEESRTMYTYEDDVAFVQAMQDSGDKWILIDDLKTFIGSKLYYRLPLLKLKRSGVLILSGFGQMTPWTFEKIRDLDYQALSLHIQLKDSLCWDLIDSPENIMNQLISLGLYGDKKYAIFTCNVEWYKDYLCGLNFPTLSWEFKDQIDKNLMCAYNEWKEQKDGVFYFSQVPPLSLAMVDVIYMLDGWDHNSLWLTMIQSYIQAPRTKPLRIVVFVDTPEKQKEYQIFAAAYDEKIKGMVDFGGLPVTICPKEKKLLIDLPVY